MVTDRKSLFNILTNNKLYKYTITNIYTKITMCLLFLGTLLYHYMNYVIVEEHIYILNVVTILSKTIPQEMIQYKQ